LALHLLEPFGNRLTRADSMAEAVERAGKDRFETAPRHHLVPRPFVLL